MWHNTFKTFEPYTELILLFENFYMKKNVLRRNCPPRARAIAYNDKEDIDITELTLDTIHLSRLLSDPANCFIPLNISAADEVCDKIATLLLKKVLF